MMILLLLVRLSIDNNMKKNKTYLKPKIKAQKVNLNMFYRKVSFNGRENMYLASCVITSGRICPVSCGSCTINN